jgi:hypothetical protein
MIEKIRFNLTENRDSIIDAMKLENMNHKYNFYYDETNNIRKLRLKENGTFNIQTNEINKNFVLGGITCEQNNQLLDIQQLKDDLQLDKNNNEIKFKHIARGTFKECLTSKKLNIFLDWLLNSDLYIHYSSIDILYWSIVDIIESSSQYYSQFRYENLNYYKMLLYEITKVDLKEFLKILTKYNYPNIIEKKRNKFLSELMVFIDRNKQPVIDDIDIVDNFSILVLLDILKSSKNQELTFIENNIDLELIDTFSYFYQRPLGLFNTSRHIFDEEEQIIDYFNKFEFYDNNKKLQNFDFKKSHENYLIQIADVTVGILGKYMTFINELKFVNIPEIKNELNSFQKDTLTKLFELLRKSELMNKAFVHHIAPFTAIEKGRLLALCFSN